jgi:hypothetical protein
MSQPAQTQHSAPAAAFIRELEAADLAWSLKKLVGRAFEGGVTEVGALCAHVEEQAAAKPRWATQDGDDARPEKWERVVRAIRLDRVGFRAYVARRVEWLGLSPAEQQLRLDAGRKSPTEKQRALIRELGGDTSIDDRWKASRAIDKLLRERDGLRGAGAA